MPTSDRCFFIRVTLLNTGVIEDENPSIGLILCAEKNEALAHYTLENLPNKVLAKEYKTVLPDEKILAREIEKTRKMLSGRKL